MATQGMTVPELINVLWVSQSTKYVAGETMSISIPLTLKPIIGQHGINTIAKRFKKLVKSDDISMSQGNAWIMMYKSEHDGLITKQTGRATLDGVPDASTTKQAKIPRPPNAFILYRQRHHPIIKEQYPGYSNNRISVILGSQWKLETDEIKDYYIKLAASVKEQHLKDHPGYSYQPRKSADKKRRMTPKKAEKLNSIAACLLAGSDATVDGANGSDGVVPNFNIDEAGDITFELGNEDVDDQTFTSMLHSTNMANLMAYGNAHGKLNTMDAPGELRNAFQGAGYNDQADMVSEFARDPSFPLATKPLKGATMGDIQAFDTNGESQPVVTPQAAGPSHESRLFFDTVFDWNALNAQANALQQQLQVANNIMGQNQWLQAPDAQRSQMYAQTLANFEGNSLARVDSDFVGI